MSALLTQSPGDTVQTVTGKIDPARKFKCTTAARDIPKFLVLLHLQNYVTKYVTASSLGRYIELNLPSV